jgi:hypothetical protein
VHLPFEKGCLALHMYICVYTRTHVHTHTYVYIYIYIYTYMHICIMRAKDMWKFVRVKCVDIYICMDDGL